MQTTSYQYVKAILERSRNSGIMLSHNPKTAREVIEEYRRAEAPCVLVSPAVGTGYDFPMDVCRFNIITKVPFPMSADPVVGARIKDNKGYRNHLAAVSLRQRVGRGNRSKEDFCQSFILDDHFAWFRRAARFSKAFQKTWRWSEQVPEAQEVR